MPMNAEQKGFLIWLCLLGGMLAGGLILRLIADGLIASMETTADMNMFSWLGMFSGLAFSVVTPVMAIITLRYGGRYATAIREHVTFSRLLTAYRILFWLVVICALLVAAGLIWLGTHIGPVR